MDITYLVNQIKAPQPGLRLRQGYVASHDSGAKTIGVRIAGDSNILPGVRYLKSYSPTVGDTIWLLNSGADLLAIGNQA